MASEMNIKCIENLVKEAAVSYLQSENADNDSPQKGITRASKLNTGTPVKEDKDNHGIPKLFLVMINEATKQLLEHQTNKYNEQKEYFEDELKRKDEYIEGKLKQKDEKISQLESYIDEIRFQVDATGQYSRRENLKIIGVPYDKNENVTEIVKEIAKHNGVELEDRDISVAHRIMNKDDTGNSSQTTGNPRPKQIPTIIFKCVQRDVKTKVFDTRKQIVAKPGCKYPNAQIYEDVTPLRSRMMYELRQRKDGDGPDARKVYRYVWSREGRIFARTAEEAIQNPQPRPHRINRPQDLKKLGWSDCEISAIIHNKRIY